MTETVSRTFEVAYSVGKKSKSSYLEDEVQTSSALLDAYDVTRMQNYPSLAHGIMQRTIERYWDQVAGGFLDLPRGDKTQTSLAMIMIVWMESRRRGVHQSKKHHPGNQPWFNGF
jgi:uncharacterized protein YyaL (SSP411 family)